MKKINKNCKKRDHTKNDHPIEKKGPLGGFFNYVRGHYVNQCPNKGQGNQFQRYSVISKENFLAKDSCSCMDNFQEEYKVAPIETTSILFGIPISILIDIGASQSFITPRYCKKQFLSRMTIWLTHCKLNA